MHCEFVPGTYKSTLGPMATKPMVAKAESTTHDAKEKVKECEEAGEESAGDSSAQGQRPEADLASPRPSRCSSSSSPSALTSAHCSNAASPASTAASPASSAAASASSPAHPTAISSTSPRRLLRRAVHLEGKARGGHRVTDGSTIAQ